MKHFNESTQALVFPLLPTQSVIQTANHSVSQLFSFTICWLVSAKSAMGRNDCMLPVLVVSARSRTTKTRTWPRRQQRFNKYSTVAKKLAAAIYALE